MRTFHAAAALWAALFFGSCTLTSPSGAPDLIIRTGTSFGFCAGYCTREVYLDADTARITITGRAGRDAETHPDKRYSESMQREQWQRLVSLVDLDAMSALQDVYGCPDCADGGAEWIEVEQHGRSKRITFEYNHSVAPVDSLIEAVRAIREHLEQKAEGGT